ncbi:MAG: glycosyltransferase family 4 protein [Methanolobus sp.]|nr:glycosyltransferase family 4 protein [Methanolobus sp.]
MKIAFVYDAVYPWVKGGAEKRIYELGRRLARQGHDVHLFGIRWWEGEDVIEREGMVLHGVCAPRDLYTGDRRSITEAIVFAMNLYPHLMHERFDLIDVSVFPYFPCFTVKLVSAVKRTSACYTWHEVWDDYWYEYMGRTGFFGKLVERAVAWISINNIAVSELTEKRLRYLGVPEKDISVIPNGIDIKSIAETGQDKEQAAAIDTDRRKYDIVFAGRLIREKNVDIIIRATSLLKKDIPDIRCCIIGEGPRKEELVNLALELGIDGNVDFADFLDYGILIKKLRASRVFLLPSSREGFGISVIEAFACGIPVITVNQEYNAAQYLVSDGVDGFVVLLNEKEVAARTRTLLLEENYEAFSRAARQKAEKYDWEIIVEQFMRTTEIGPLPERTL